MKDLCEQIIKFTLNIFKACMSKLKQQIKQTIKLTNKGKNKEQNKETIRGVA